MPPTTLKDIVKVLMFAPSTISWALRNHPHISADTKKREMSLAKAMDYHPYSLARSLQTRKTSTNSVIVPKINHPFFAEVINGIEAQAFHSGYTIIVCQSNEPYERDVVYPCPHVSHRVAGLLFSLSRRIEDFEHLKVLLRRDIHPN